MAVDTSSMGGCSWVDITLDRDEKPWITYRDLSRPDYYDGAKIAFRNDAIYRKASRDGSGIDNKGWEAVIIPTRNVVLDDRLSIESAPTDDLLTSNGWEAAVGYRSADLFRIVYYSKVSGTIPPTK
jgi:hypothetical protein